jgi:hypothetical protein
LHWILARPHRPQFNEGNTTIMQKTAKPVKKSKSLSSAKKLEKKVPLNSFKTLTKFGPVGKI